MKTWLYSLACFVLLCLAFSCTDKKSKDKQLTESKLEYDTTKNLQIVGELILGDTMRVVPDLDTLNRSTMDKVSRYDIPVKENNLLTFCGDVKDASMTAYKIKIFYNKKGLSWTKKMAMGRIRFGDRFFYEFKVPADGLVEITIEREQTIGWKTMKLDTTTVVPANCCPRTQPAPGTPTPRTLGRTSVVTTDTTGSGATVKVEQ